MAKRDVKQEPEEVEVSNVLQLSKTLIRELNKNGKEKVAWCLATDGDNPTDVKDFIPTGSTLLDYIMTNRRGGGIPVGKLTEIIGEEASGKSLLLTQILANTQKKGGLAVLFDEENALNPEFAERVGLDIQKLVYMQAGCVESVGENIEKIINLARSKDVKRIITIGWDSVAATPPKAELEGDYDPNSRVGLQAKAIAKMLRKLTSTIGREKVTLVFTNQMKVKIGVMFGDPMGTPGGKAIPYHASIRVRLNRSTELKEEDDDKTVYAVHTRAKVIKGRLGPPLRKCEFDIHFAKGVDDASSILAYLHSVGEVEKAMGKMYLKFIPNGVITKWRSENKDNEGDRGIQVSDESFEVLWNDREMRGKILDVLDQHMIVRFDAKVIPDQELDPESLMDAEAVNQMVMEGA